MTVEVALGSVLAGFRIERLLGSGAMGAVYLAEDVHLKRKVAVKVLARELAQDERFRRRFLLESQLAASLEHPHIVPIYGAGEEGDVLYLAMKYVEGYDLRELIDASERLEDERALNLLGQIGDALDAAHGLGLVHRDVKPANILIGPGDVEHGYLCDFGLARHASTVASLTSEHGFVGTISYVAPEQIESGAVDSRADVYALGCVLYECLTGVTPFDRDGDLQVVFAHLKEPPPLITSLRPDLADEIDAVVHKALAKSPDERFSTCGELVAEAVEALKVKPPEVSRSMRRTIPGVRTFFIADVRGYTRYTAERGDEAAAALASTFADIVRQVVEAREGRLIELRGDEALVVFDSARQALRSAVELQARVADAELPRGIGIGLDAGEAVPVADGYRGGALNLAARLCSLAGPGEVLASETVLQLARAMDEVSYGERRVERVKGIAKPVTAVEVLPSGMSARRWDRKRLGRATRRRLRSRRVRAGALAVVAIGAAIATFLSLTGSGSGATKIAPRAIGFISPTGKVDGQVPVSGSGPLGVLGNTLWFGNGDDKTLERIDLRTRKLVHPFVSIQNGFGGMAVGLGAIWVVDGKEPALLRVDPRFLTIERIRLPAKKSEIDFTAGTEAAIGAGSVWVAEANKVFRVDPASLRVVHAIDVPQADVVAFGDGALWVGQSNLSSISKIDPATNQVVQTLRLRNWVGSIAVGGGFVWAAVSPDDTLWKIDKNGTVEKTLDVGHPIGVVKFFDGAAWVGSGGLMQRVDAESDEITSFEIVDRPGDLAVGDGALYVSTGESPPKLEPMPADKVATFSLAENWVDDTDPAHAWPTAYRSQVEYATGAQLLNYPDAPAPRGSQLVPEVAAAMPHVSTDGRTYTFRVRRGFRFSPPSTQDVTAETFKYSIERALSSGLGDDAAFIFLKDVAGASAFRAGKADHVSGLSARGDVLRIRLAAPAGDFLTRLSMPFFAAVPIGTPIVNGGVQEPISSAGPYYIRVRWSDELLVLEQNPNYHGSRPHRLERIVYDIGNSSRRIVAQIEDGAADYTADLLQVSTFAASGPLATRFGEARGDTPARLVQTPQLGFGFFRFNMGRGPFVDVRLRRVVNYAIDRRALAAVYDEIPSDSYVPPGLAAATKSHVYPLSPDLARARALARGFRGPVVLYACTRPDCVAVSRILRANLERLGISLKVRRFDDPFSEAQKAGAPYDMLQLGWQYDWPDPSSVLNGFLDPQAFRPEYLPPAFPIPASYLHALRRAALLTGPARVAAYRRLSVKIERELAPFAAYSTPVLPEFFSERVGCRLEHPIIAAVDIGTLCVKES
jgi:ABC-type oligopeptide transport system substrate-binding subunit/class 3 adenylate cyclase/streptogramin lyase/tRNA A-37 threonylcarbamoyl transferase component Bud32